ncbi:unnamed protein product [Caenorhabditis brenneri]
MKRISFEPYLLLCKPEAPQQLHEKWALYGLSVSQYCDDIRTHTKKWDRALNDRKLLNTSEYAVADKLKSEKKIRQYEILQFGVSNLAPDNKNRKSVYIECSMKFETPARPSDNMKLNVMNSIKTVVLSDFGLFTFRFFLILHN